MKARIILWITIAASLLALLLGIADTFFEGEPIRLGPVLFDLAEKLVLVGAMFASALVVLKVTALEDATRSLKKDMAWAREEGEAWRQNSRAWLDGLSGAIARQFDTWGLTPAEADIAGLMLKGMSLQEIAGLRDRSQTTIRQQAQSVYRKSGLSGRAELSAYFLEDLFERAEDSAAASPVAAAPRPADRREALALRIG